MSNASRLKIVAHASIDACFELPVTKKLVAVLFNKQKGVYRMNEYSIYGDMLNKLSQLTPWVQAVVAVGFFGMVVALAYFFKESVVAVMRPLCRNEKLTSEEPKKEWKDKYYRGQDE